MVVLPHKHPLSTEGSINYRKGHRRGTVSTLCVASAGSYVRICTMCQETPKWMVEVFHGLSVSFITEESEPQLQQSHETVGTTGLSNHGPVRFKRFLNEKFHISGTAPSTKFHKHRLQNPRQRFHSWQRSFSRNAANASERSLGN